MLTSTYDFYTLARAFHKLLESLQKVSGISQKVAQKSLKKQSKVAFCNESCSKVARKNKTCFGSDAKICKLYNKSKISKHFCAILGLNQRC